MSVDIESLNKYVEERYKNAIAYYWKASRTNKNGYKYTRGLTVILGALVTLAASVASAYNFSDDPCWIGKVFSVFTPFLAASLTIIAGFSQSFQWGATWKDMVMTAQILEKERDRFLVTKLEDRDFVKELEILNNFILQESQHFFDRLIGSGEGAKPSKALADIIVTDVQAD
jgi:hypothetical protein